MSPVTAIRKPFILRFTPLQSSPSVSRIHPITVHYPLTTLLASYGIDSLIVGRRYLPQMVSAVLPATKILSEISYYSNLAGLVLLVPAVITGFHEWWEIAKYKGENKFVDGIVSIFVFFRLTVSEALGVLRLVVSCRRYSRTRTAHSTSRRFTVSSTSPSVRNLFLPFFAFPNCNDAQTSLPAGAYSVWTWRQRRLVPNHMPSTRIGVLSGVMLGSLVLSVSPPNLAVFRGSCAAR